MPRRRSVQPKSRAELAAERHRTAMKHFDLAEAPLKAWIAAYLGVQPGELYRDWEEAYEILNIESDEKFYILYWSPIDAEQGSQRWDIALEDFKRAPSLQEAGCMMLASIRTVFDSCVEVMESKKEEIADNNLVPFFEESTMSYKFGRLNRRRREKKQLETDVLKASDLLKKVDAELAKPLPKNMPAQKEIDERERCEALIEERKKLVDARDQAITAHNAISEEECDEEEALCTTWNARLENSPRLYLFLKEAAAVPIEQRMARSEIFNVPGSHYVDNADD